MDGRTDQTVAGLALATDIETLLRDTDRDNDALDKHFIQDRGGGRHFPTCFALSESGAVVGGGGGNECELKYNTIDICKRKH